jgi:aldehyde:ferredoxin oxidoreductase
VLSVFALGADFQGEVKGMGGTRNLEYREGGWKIKVMRTRESLVQIKEGDIPKALCMGPAAEALMKLAKIKGEYILL